MEGTEGTVKTLHERTKCTREREEVGEKKRKVERKETGMTVRPDIFPLR